MLKGFGLCWSESIRSTKGYQGPTPPLHLGMCPRAHLEHLDADRVALITAAWPRAARHRGIIPAVFTD